jgi:uncharacterized protein YacL (UPF0231 family)
MKYYKIIDHTDQATWYISSTLVEESVGHVAMSQHLDPTHKYTVTEVSGSEYMRWNYSLRRLHDMDIEDDLDYDDDDSDCYCGD